MPMIDGDSKQSPKWINQKEMKNELTGQPRVDWGECHQPNPPMLINEPNWMEITNKRHYDSTLIPDIITVPTTGYISLDNGTVPLELHCIEEHPFNFRLVHLITTLIWLLKSWILEMKYSFHLIGEGRKMREEKNRRKINEWGKLMTKQMRD